MTPICYGKATHGEESVFYNKKKQFFIKIYMNQFGCRVICKRKVTHIFQKVMRISRGESYAESVRQYDVTVVILKSGNDLNKKNNLETTAVLLTQKIRYSKHNSFHN